MIEPTPAQLDALLDRAERHALSHAEAALLSATVRRLVAERNQLRLDLRGADDLTAEALNHNDRTCEAVPERDTYRGLLRDVVDLADITHRYGAMGGHDSLGRDLTCKGCALHQRIRDTLAAPYPPVADTETARDET